MTNTVEYNSKKNELLLKISGFTKSTEQLEIMQKLRENAPKLDTNAKFLVDLSEFKVTEDVNMIVKGMSGNLIPQVKKTAIVLPKSAVGNLTINSILQRGSTGDSGAVMELFTEVDEATNWLAQI